MKLSEHFSLSEFLRSEVAARQGFDLTPSPKVIENLTRLCNEVLEPLRLLTGPLIVTSGYRSIALNSFIGGAPNSDHIQGLAADVHALNLDIPALAKIVRSANIPGLAKGILEFGQWCHCSVHEPGQVAVPMFLVAELDQSRNTRYREWIA